MENPYKIGDFVILTEDIKDAYGEIWHTKGSKVRVKYIASDGQGLMFSSNLGTHWKNVELATMPSEIQIQIQNNRTEIIQECIKQLGKIDHEIDKNFFSLSQFPQSVDTSNKINYARSAISLAISILRDIKT